MSKISTYSLADSPLQLSDRLIGTEAVRPIPSPTPLATKNFSLGELLQLFSSNFPAATLQAVLNAGNIATQDINLTGTINVTLIKPTNIEDMLGSQGTTFQILSKAIGGFNWVDPPVSITLTTTGSSGPSTLIGGVLNIPIYSGGIGTTPNLQEVTTEGNVTSDDLIVRYALGNQISFTSVVGGSYVVSEFGSSVFQAGAQSGESIILMSDDRGFATIYSNTASFSDAAGGGNVLIDSRESAIFLGNLGYVSFAGINGGLAKIKSDLIISATDLDQQIPNKSGTFAMLDDIPAPLLSNITPDAYLGLRLQPSDASNNGFYINKSVNQSVGYYARNTDNVGNGAVSAFYVGGTGTLYQNQASLFHANNGYFVPYLRGKNGISSNNDFFFVGHEGASFDFRTGASTFGGETSKFSISNTGVLQIGVQPTLDNTITEILGRKSDGTIVRVDKPTKTSDLTNDGEDGVNPFITAADIPAAGVTSVGLTMPSAFAVTNSPITSSGDIAVTGAGLVSQYIRGDGTLANFPSSSGGGSSVNYYLNGSVSQGVFGGNTYYQMSKTPILGAGTNFIRTNGAGNGYIASFITDVADPSQLNIPGGNWNLEFYFNASSGGGSPSFYAEIYKVSVTNVFTLVATGSANPEGITNGTTVDQYFTSIPVPQTSLLITDRLAIRIYVITSGRTITLHTENGNLCEVLTTFTTGLTALNGLTAQVQYFDEGTNGTDFNISSTTDTHTFNLPTASATNRGALSSADWTIFNSVQSRKKIVIKDNVLSTTVTLVSAAEVLVKTYTIPAGTFVDGDIFSFILSAIKTGATQALNIRVKVNTTNNFATSTSIALYTVTPFNNTSIGVTRQRIYFSGTNLIGANATISLNTDISLNTSANFSVSLNPANQFFVFISLAGVGFTSDTGTINYFQITN